MKFVSALFLISAVPSLAFVSPLQNTGKILTSSNDKNSECTATSPPALSASIDVAYVNDVMDITSSIMSNPDILLPAAGAAAVAAIGAAVGLRSSGNENTTTSNAIEEEVPKIDVSIEYDAPAKLAFEKLAKGGDADYTKFKELYESKAVTEVKKKVYEQKVARETSRRDTEIADMQKEIDCMFN